MEHSLVFIPVNMFSYYLPFYGRFKGDTHGITSRWHYVLILMFSVFGIAISLVSSCHFPELPGFICPRTGSVPLYSSLRKSMIIMQFILGQTFGRYKILPKVKSNKIDGSFPSAVSSVPSLPLVSPDFLSAPNVILRVSALLRLPDSRRRSHLRYSDERDS